MKAQIKNIQITNRIRKEITKIDELAADIGYCTDANERERYDVLMRMCDNDAARILKEYRGVSPELKDILQRVAAYEVSRPQKRRQERSKKRDFNISFFFQRLIAYI